MLNCKYSQKTVQDLFDLFNAKRLNLEPGFQRKRVWTDKDRRALIDSVMKRYPLPSVFLYHRSDGGVPVYDVLDGRQRIETLLMFAGQIRGARFGYSPEGEKEAIDWADLRREGKQHIILSFELQVAEVSGEWEEIVSLFVRLNSTGKKLDRAEISHAKFHGSELLKAAATLGQHWRRYLIEAGILSPGQEDRFKHIELMCELIVSACNKSVINKKDALERAMAGNGALKDRELKASVIATRSALSHFRNLIRRPRETRFYKLSDFYSLVVLLQQLHREKFVLHDAQRNGQARQILIGLSTGVDKLNLMSKRLEFSDLQADQQLFRTYLQTVKEGTDALSNRKQRHEILYRLIAPIFERKDEDRLFNEEQRRILWNSAEEKRCPDCPRGSRLHWSDLTIDHVKPHALGGKTVFENAEIRCRKHNSRKGMKPKRAA